MTPLLKQKEKGELSLTKKQVWQLFLLLGLRSWEAMIARMKNREAVQMSGTEQQYYYSDDHSRSQGADDYFFFHFFLLFAYYLLLLKYLRIIIFLPEALRKAGANTTYTSYYTFYSNTLFSKKKCYISSYTLLFIL